MFNPKIAYDFQLLYSIMKTRPTKQIWTSLLWMFP